MPIKLDVDNGKLVQIPFWKSLTLRFNSAARTACAERLDVFARKALGEISESDPVEKRVAAFELVEGLVQQCKSSQLDQLIMTKKATLWPRHQFKATEYQLPSNQKNFDRWLKYGFDQDTFIKYPDFAQFLIKFYIGSAMSMWGHQLFIFGDRPQILWNGKYEDWELVRDAVELRYHAETGKHRLYDKASCQPMEFLNDGRGLVICDRYRAAQGLPITHQIGPFELEHIRSLAKQYVRPSEEDGQKVRDYVLQVVSTRKPNGGSNFETLFMETAHPYLRLISPDGKVKCIGFMKFNKNWNILSHGKGAISTPDYSEQNGNLTQYITNIALDGSEAEQLEKYCLEVQEKPDLTFNFRGQNCTSFIWHVLSKFKLANPPEQISPLGMLYALVVPSKRRLYKFLIKPEGQSLIERLARVVNKIVSPLFFKGVLFFLLGERPFKKFGEKVEDTLLQRVKRWMSEPVHIDIPAQLQAWQKSMESTERVKKFKQVVFSSQTPVKVNFSSYHVPGFGTAAAPTRTSLWNKMTKSLTVLNPLFWIKEIGAKIHAHLYPGSHVTTLHPEIVRHNQQKGPGLGEYVKTDVRVVNDVTQSYLFKMEYLQSAQQSIDISFNFAGDSHFDEVLELIQNKMSKWSHFKAHLIISKDLLSPAQLKKIEELNTNFANQFHCLLTDRYFQFDQFIRTEENHCKMMVIDGRYFVVGGSGLHDQMHREVNPGAQNQSFSWIDSTFRDTDIFGYGPLAKSVRGQFYNLYQIWARRMNHALKPGEGLYWALDPNYLGKCNTFHEELGLIKKAWMSFVVGGPEHRGANPITRSIARRIERARSDVQIANLYFNADKMIKKALERAKKRKVRVTGYFNGIGEGISKVHYNYLFTNRQNYSTQLSRVFEYQVPDQTYHKKVTTVDARTAVVGSYNLGQKSALCDNECALVIKDPRVVAVLNEGIIEDRERSKEIYLQGPQKEKDLWWTAPASKLYGLWGAVYG